MSSETVTITSKKKEHLSHLFCILLGPVVQSVQSLIAGPGVVSVIPAWSHTLVEIYHEIFSTVNLLLLTQEGFVSVTSESMCTKY